MTRHQSKDVGAHEPHVVDLDRISELLGSRLEPLMDFVVACTDPERFEREFENLSRQK